MVGEGAGFALARELEQVFAAVRFTSLLWVFAKGDTSEIGVGMTGLQVLNN